MADEKEMVVKSQQGMLQYAKIAEIIEMCNNIINLERGTILLEQLRIHF